MSLEAEGVSLQRIKHASTIGNWRSSGRSMKSYYATSGKRRGIIIKPKFTSLSK
jgi:hypothetical protein